MLRAAFMADFELALISILFIINPISLFQKPQEHGSKNADRLVHNIRNDRLDDNSHQQITVTRKHLHILGTRNSNRGSVAELAETLHHIHHHIIDSTTLQNQQTQTPTRQADELDF